MKQATTAQARDLAVNPMVNTSNLANAVKARQQYSACLKVVRGSVGQT